MHTPDAEMARLASQALRYAIDRIRMDPPPLDAPIPYQQMLAEVGQTVTPSGIGGAEALRIYTEILAPTCISVDHPKFLSFVPGAPTEASIIFDMVVSAGSIYTGSWLEGAGAVFAENQALRWIADLARFPESAGGVFVSGGTAGNLSALIAARHRWRERAQGRHDRTRGLLVASSGAHSSVKQAALAMDADLVVVPADDKGRLNGAALESTMSALDTADRDRLFAIVATSGTTNLGVVDDLSAVADVATAHGVWFHVDGAYGAAALCAPSVRHLFDDAYTAAMEKTLDTTRFGAEEIRRRPYLELMLEPDLSILVFRRLGWTPEQYQRWSDAQLHSGQSFVVPSSWNGETVLRFCIVNPRTTNAHLVEILDSMEEEPA
ncbi:MAG: aminotransferase class V-fold PLP-dependent enzyme [Ilumatobacteraceae bacterium]|nr:aminotransferase class V-fold PLP-dependent enzyme [Ilumatobacteraceae bacterium]